MYRFIAGTPPATLAIVPEARVVLDGKRQRPRPRQPRRATSRPTCRSPARRSRSTRPTPPPASASARPLHRKTIGADGRWGPFVADGAARYEFVIAAPGYATTHIYRSPFPRSSRSSACARSASPTPTATRKSLVMLTRPRGYFGVPRDRIALDGTSPPAGIPSGVAGVSTARAQARRREPARRRRRVQRRAHRRPHLAGRRQPRRRPRADVLSARADGEAGRPALHPRLRHAARVRGAGRRRLRSRSRASASSTISTTSSMSPTSSGFGSAAARAGRTAQRALSS